MECFRQAGTTQAFHLDPLDPHKRFSGGVTATLIRRKLRCSQQRGLRGGRWPQCGVRTGAWRRQDGEKPRKEGEGAQWGLSHKKVILGEKRVGQVGEGAWGEVRALSIPARGRKATVE